MRIIRAILLVALVSLTDCHVGGDAASSRASSRARVSSTTAVAVEILPAAPGDPVGGGAAAFAHGLDGAHGGVRLEGKNNYMGKGAPPAVGTASGAGRPRPSVEHHLMSPSSMRDALRGLGLDVSAMDAHALLRRFDGDRNGGLDVREFARVGRQPAPGPAPLSRPRERAGVGAVVEDGVVNDGVPTRVGAAAADAAVAKAMVDALEGLMTLMVQNSATITGDATLNTLFRGFAGRGRGGERGGRGEREMGSRTMYEREGKSPAPEGAGADASDNTYADADADTADGDTADADANTAAASYAAPEPDTTNGAELSFLEVGALTHNLGASSVKGRHAHSARSEHQDAASKDGLAQALAAGNFAKLIQMQQRQQSEMQREFASQREEIALLKKEYHHDHDAQVRGGVYFLGEESGGRTAV
jgi:hypothetical protein